MRRTRGDLLSKLEDRLRAPLSRALRQAVSLAEAGDVEVFLVAGVVRDLLLGQAPLDIDLVVGGDACALAERVAGALDARLVTHRRFGTAAVLGEGFRLDLAGARSESYERPGALPKVRPANLEDDLGRRDFTINAMALRLTGPDAGQLIDPHGGRNDLDRRVLRVLHDRSFEDDATRILRGLRYAGRLGFRLERGTEALVRRDASFLDTISGARLRHEFERIALEEQAAAIVRLASGLDILSRVHPALRAPETAIEAAGRLGEASSSHRDALLLCALLAGATPAEAESAIARLALTGRQAGAVRGLVALRREEARLAERSLRPSEAVRVLAPHATLAVEALALVSRRARAAERARRYLDGWRFLRPRLNGRAIEELGVPHGPRVGEALALLKEARLDGRTANREDEIALVRREGFLERELVEARRA